MHNQTYQNYQALVHLDSVLNDFTPKYPYVLNQRAQYTQHQVILYQSNYCHTDTEPPVEQPSVTGGAVVQVVLI